MRFGEPQTFRRARAIRAAFRQGRLIVYATESCFGIGCDPRNQKALRRLLRLKSRPWHKGLLLIAADAAQLTPWIVTPTAAQAEKLTASWPGPNTWIIRASPRVPHALKGRHAGIGVRVPAHRGAAALAHIVGSAVVSTSANPAGLRPLKNYRAAQRRFGSNAFVIAGRIGARKRPSTIRILETGAVLRA